MEIVPITSSLCFGGFLEPNVSVCNCEALYELFKSGSSRILVGAEGGFHAQFSAVEEDSNAEVLELAEAFGS